MLLPSVTDPSGAEAITAGGRSISYLELHRAASAVAARLAGHERVAVWATPSLETCVGVVGVLLSAASAVPINPQMGPMELGHVAADSSPSAVVAAPHSTLPDLLYRLPRIDVDLDARGAPLPEEPDDEAPAFVFYTSG